MKMFDDSVSSEYLNYKINEDIIIYEGKFCAYINKKYKCIGKIIYKVSHPISIKFEGNIIVSEEISNDCYLDYDNSLLEVYGYKPIYASVTSLTDFKIEGYINDHEIKSKNAIVEYVDFNILNLEKFPGKLIKYENKVFAGRIEFELNNFIITIDKRYDYRKELAEELKMKSGTIITHTGRIKRKDNKPFKTNNIAKYLDKISTSLTFMCGRYVDICLARGYINDTNVYRIWRECIIPTYKFVPTWCDTISNYHNIEKYITLMCKKLEDSYYGDAINQVVNWYIESLTNNTLENTIISVQIALETLSYVVLVEQHKTLTDSEFDFNTSITNIKLLLENCNIPFDKNDLVEFDEDIRSKFSDGVDLMVYFRNKIVHPSRKGYKVLLELEDLWNIIQIGTRYIELVILSIIGYRGEYSNRLKDRWFGEVEVVPWAND